MYLHHEPWRRLWKKRFDKNLRLKRMILFGTIRERSFGIQKVLNLDHQRNNLGTLRTTNLRTKVVEPETSKEIFM